MACAPPHLQAIVERVAQRNQASADEHHILARVAKLLVVNHGLLALTAGRGHNAGPASTDLLLQAGLQGQGRCLQKRAACRCTLQQASEHSVPSSSTGRARGCRCTDYTGPLGHKLRAIAPCPTQVTGAMAEVKGLRMARHGPTRGPEAMDKLAAIFHCKHFTTTAACVLLEMDLCNVQWT